MTNISHQNTKFLYFIAYLQIIGIILVVFGHSMHQYDSNFGRDLLVYRLMYSFRMPLFLFVSGFLMVYTTVRNNKFQSLASFAAKKFKRLLIPFLFISTVIFVPRAMMSGIADEGLTLSWQSFFSSFVFSDSFVIPYYWFLYTSFTLLVVTYASVCLARKINMHCVPVALLVLLALFVVMRCLHVLDYTDFLSIYNTVDKGAFFVAGALYCYYYDNIERRMGVIISSPYFAAFCMVAWAFLFRVAEGSNLMMVCSLFGIFMCVSIAKIMVAKHVTALDHLKGSTYMIFLLSWFFNIASQQILAHFTSFQWWVYSALSLVTGIYGPWLIYRIIKRYNTHRISRIASLLLGQNTSVS